LRIVIYRVVQEAMNNISKHRKADLVRLSLWRMDRKMQLTIQDNGQRFNLKKVISQEVERKEKFKKRIFKVIDRKVYFIPSEEAEWDSFWRRRESGSKNSSLGPTGLTAT
jgi:hypothetical protein